MLAKHLLILSRRLVLQKIDQFFLQVDHHFANTFKKFAQSQRLNLEKEY